MEKKLTSALLSFIVILITGNAFAQPATEWDKTSRLEGLWIGQAQLKLGSDSFNVTYSADFKSTAGGSGLIMEEGFSDPVIGELKGTNLIGFNPNDGMIHWFSVDNLGTTHDHSGNWINPTHFYMIHQSQLGTQTFTEYIHMRLRANCTRLHLELIATLDADTVQVLNGIFYLQNTANRAGNTKYAINEANEISIYPNPSEGMINIESVEKIKEIVISNSAGEIIYQGSPAAADYQYKIYNSGLYIISVVTENEKVTRKVIVQ